MAATGYTPISLYYSTTASAVPTSGNLANGELALNIADMKLYAKNSAGTVTLLASNSGATGTVSSVSGTGTVSGITLSGTVTSSGSLTLGGTLDLSSYNGAGAFTTLAASSSVTLSGGTANGVTYLNGSKVLTSGSALTFDGSTLNFGGTAQRITGDFSNATVANRLLFQNNVVNGTTSLGLIPNGTNLNSQVQLYNSSDSANAGRFRLAVSGTSASLVSDIVGTGTYLPMTFLTDGSEQMRLTSTGLGIGTSSPARKLQVNSSEAVAARFTRGGGIVANNSLEWFDGTNGWYAGVSGSNFWGVAYNSSGAIDSAAFRIDSAGVVSDQYGKLRAIPPVGTKTGSYTLTTADVGRYVQVGSGGSITIPNSVFAEGDVVSIFNNTSGNITITCTIATAYKAGTDADQATVTLQTRGVATVLFISGTVCVISGNLA